MQLVTCNWSQCSCTILEILGPLRIMLNLLCLCSINGRAKVWMTEIGRDHEGWLKSYFLVSRLWIPPCSLPFLVSPPWSLHQVSPPWSLLHSVPTTLSLSRSEEHTSELQSHSDLVCRLLLEKKKSFQIMIAFWQCTWTPKSSDEDVQRN